MKTPKVGDGATRLLLSDRRACTVVGMIGDDTVVVQDDRAIRTDNNGISETQEYRYEPNPKGAVFLFTRRRTGDWVKSGESVKHGERLRLGERSHYYDPSH